MYDNIPADCWHRSDAPWLQTDDIYVCPICDGLGHFFENESGKKISEAEWAALPPEEQENFEEWYCHECGHLPIKHS